MSDKIISDGLFSQKTHDVMRLTYIQYNKFAFFRTNYVCVLFALILK